MCASVNSRRGYDSPRRREQAAETRRKILDAAEELFVRDGYAATAMPAIAERAGVALKTVYLGFGTKAGVLHGLWDTRLGGDDQPIAVVERPWYRQLLQGGDPASLVRIAARQSRAVKERAGELMRIIRQAADTEPALADLWDRIQTEFRAVLGGFAERLDELGALAPGVDVTLATDLLWTLNHPDTWYLLVRCCGWTADRYEQWVGDTLSAQLLGAARSGEGTGLCTASAGDNKDNFTAYKLLIADVIGGKLTVVPRGIMAAGNVMQGARGGANLPDRDIDRVKSHLAKYYAKMGEEAPWERD